MIHPFYSVSKSILLQIFIFVKKYLKMEIKSILTARLLETILIIPPLHYGSLFLGLR